MANVNELLSGFGELIGIPELELDDEGGCCLSFDDVELDFDHDTERGEFLLTSPLGRIPEGVDAGTVLRANFQNALTGPGSLGWNASTERLTFVHRIQISDLDGEGLELALREILDRVQFWTEWLRTLPVDTTDLSQPETAIRI